LWFEKEIEYARMQLSLCDDFFPVLFFDCFYKDQNQRIIPSAMEYYLHEFGLDI
jgi:hypothetical protein